MSGLAIVYKRRLVSYRCKKRKTYLTINSSYHSFCERSELIVIIDVCKIEHMAIESTNTAIVPPFLAIARALAVNPPAH